MQKAQVYVKLTTNTAQIIVEKKCLGYLAASNAIHNRKLQNYYFSKIKKGCQKSEISHFYQYTTRSNL